MAMEEGGRRSCDALSVVRCTRPWMQPQGKAAFYKRLVVGWALEAERLVGESFLGGTGKERRKSVPSERPYHM